MSSYLRDAGSDVYADVSSRLGEGLVTATPQSKIVLLRALSNAKDPSLLPVASSELDASELMVRTAAIKAISAVNSAESHDLMVKHLGRETTSRGRVALVDAIAKQNHKDVGVFSSFAELISTEKNTDVREALARCLADNIGSYPDSRDMLEGILKDGSNSSAVRAYITAKLHPKSKVNRR